MLCITCKIELTGRQTKYCSARCRRKHYRLLDPAKHVRQNRVSIRNQQKKRYEYVAKLKNNPCADCGNTYPTPAMDFDHVRGTKVRGISQAVIYGWKPLYEEIAKCELVCSNCHRVRTHSRNTYYGKRRVLE